MLQVVPLRYGVAFKKAFRDVEVFRAFVADVLGIEIEISEVREEFTYPDPVGKARTEYDLFAEDERHRIIVEVQHVKEADFYDRFLYYHLVSLVEQVSGYREYRLARTVYTVVVLTSVPRDGTARFGVAASDMDLTDDEGRRLGIYGHRLVFLNARRASERMAPGVRKWLELIEDTLDGAVEEERYEDEIRRRVIGAIRTERITPEELARVKDEAAWEAAKQEARKEGIEEGVEEGIEKGIEKGRKEIARRMLEEGMPVEQIALLTGLSAGEIAGT
ncbi:MAG: Rpn family recombination-promoting nuclease/putative transposase [Candidatus Schekmanbacteria bacterium]|nr:Rpn family recombination-promoting nuclease/putative transposase [Candidatus Schekmanbacteria bacterium]